MIKQLAIVLLALSSFSCMEEPEVPAFVKPAQVQTDVDEKIVITEKTQKVPSDTMAAESASWEASCIRGPDCIGTKNGAKRISSTSPERLKYVQWMVVDGGSYPPLIGATRGRAPIFKKE